MHVQCLFVKKDPFYINFWTSLIPPLNFQVQPLGRISIFFLNNFDDTLLMHGDDIIERVDKFKYLGVIFDALSARSEHVNYISSIVSKRIGVICRVKSYLPPSTLNLLASSAVVGMFFPYWHVGIIWSWHRHACRHNSNFKIEWNTRRKNKSFSGYTRIHYKLTLIPIHFAVIQTWKSSPKYTPEEAKYCL